MWGKRAAAIAGRYYNRIYKVTGFQDALVDDLPDTVMTIFQNAIDTANSGIVNWVMRQRAMRYLTVLALPYTVPIDIMYATFTK